MEDMEALDYSCEILWAKDIWSLPEVGGHSKVEDIPPLEVVRCSEVFLSGSPLLDFLLTSSGSKAAGVFFGVGKADTFPSG